MRRALFTTGALALLAGASAASAQTRWSLELSGGAAFATEKVGGADLSPGFGLGLAANYRFMPHLSVYGGWDWHRFSVDETAGGDLEDNGYMFGLRFEHPLFAGVSYWARAGGIANHIEVQDESGALAWDSGHDLGWEVGAGFSVPVRPRLKLTPGVRFRSLSRDVDIDGATTPTDLRYVVVGTGIVYTF
jgi:hypothetical protein